jgi:hypothetical protein
VKPYVVIAALTAAAAVRAAARAEEAAPESLTRLGIDGERFTIGGKAEFIPGMSVYGALGAPEAALRGDLDEIRRRGCRWIRVWATWGAFGNDVSAVDAEGRPREPFLGKLRTLVAECGRRGLVVDVSLSRGNGVAGKPRLQSLEAHRRAVETLAGALKPYRNWYLDLANERNIKDERFASIADLKELREAVRRLDPERLVTASHAGDIDPGELREYLLEVRVDFIAPHRPRNASSPAETEARTREYLAAMKALGRVVPVHYQEPFRRGFGTWEPRAADFRLDLEGARAGGAAGWCFHNGDERGRPDGAPRRSFDLRERRLFDALDAEERAFLADLARAPLSPPARSRD